MSRALLGLAAALGLAACSAPPRLAEGRVIACALGGASAFAPTCRVETVEQGSHRLLVVHHPDGGFRRFEAVSDGRGVIVADGVESAAARWSGAGVLEVTVGQDRYRFPARLKPGAGLAPNG